ncbi:RTA1 like protein [Penicillium nucicola]|uniref:RTA1 like protein n=1 Tax=Penicillium nucicola TaxID=1850975 RepID=UPI0025455050|nr:RTA1 like protein [Penicillium nucicola]KAJ5766317.1 RTA1 like protein [Penicillium nucicola]
MAAKYVLYNYTPSYVAAVCFTAAFLISGMGHIWQASVNKTAFLTPFIIGILFEACGYAARAVNAKQAPDYAVGPYSMQSLLLLLAPSLLAASIYMILGRIINLVDGGSRALIRPQKLTKVFVTGDVLSFLVQSGGGAILAQAKSQSKVTLGERMIVVGLFVQILFFGVFMAVSAHFHKNITADPTPRSLSTTRPWQKYLIALYVASFIIMVRSIYRVVEYIQGTTGYLQSHEVFLYVFDSMLMIAVCFELNIFHPSRVLPHGNELIEDGEYLPMR